MEDASEPHTKLKPDENVALLTQENTTNPSTNDKASDSNPVNTDLE